LIVRDEKGRFVKGVRVPTCRNISRRIFKKCFFCLKEFSCKQSQPWVETCSISCGVRLRIARKGAPNKGRKFGLETKLKQRLAKLGIRGGSHWNWKGANRTERKRAMQRDEYIQWRKKVFERDNYICQKCFQKGSFLHAHHIIHWAKNINLRYDLNNGITLCKTCHGEEHPNLKKLISRG
jgi:hypothetical protein